MLGNGHTAESVSMAKRRAFASSGSNLATWGFIGLGRMGKLNSTSNLVRFADVDFY